MYFRAFHGVPESVDGAGRHTDRCGAWVPGRRHAACSPTIRPPTSSPASTPTGGRTGGSRSCPRTRRTASTPTQGPDAEEVPDALAPQVPVIEAVLDAIGHRPGRGRRTSRPTTSSPPWPARRPMPVDIVTGDRDLFQLADDRVPRHRPVHRQGLREGRTRHGRGPFASGTASRPPRTPTSRRCAATRRTVCRAYAGSATSPRQAVIAAYPTIGVAAAPRWRTRRPTSRTAARSRPRATTSRRAIAVVRVRTDVPLPSVDIGTADAGRPEHSSRSPPVGLAAREPLMSAWRVA